MLKAVQIRWVYGLSALVAALSIGGFYVNLPLAFLIPVAVFLVWMGIYAFDKLFYLVSFLIPVSVILRDAGFGLGMSLPSEPIIACMMLGVLMKLVLGSTFNSRFIRHPLTIIVLLHLFWMFLTAVFSTMPQVSLKFFLSRTWFVVVFYFAGGQLFSSIRSMKVFLWCFIISTALIVAYTIFKHAQYSFSRGTSYSIMYPFYVDHGIYAAAISFFIPALIGMVIWGQRLHISVLSRIFGLGLLVILLTGIVFSFTRAAWMSLAAAAAVYVILLLRIRFRTIMWTIIGLLGVFFYFQQDILQKLGQNKQRSDDDLSDHLQSMYNISSDPSNLERINRWKSALRMFNDKPVMGFGPGTYVFQYAPYQNSADLTIISTNTGTLGSAHSEYLGTLAEQGIPGLLILIVLVFATFYYGQRLYYRASYPHLPVLALGVLLGLVTYFVHGAMNNYTEYDKIAAPFYAFLGMITALDVFHRSLHPERDEQ